MHALAGVARGLSDDGLGATCTWAEVRSSPAVATRTRSSPTVSNHCSVRSISNTASRCRNASSVISSTRSSTVQAISVPDWTGRPHFRSSPPSTVSGRRSIRSPRPGRTTTRSSPRLRGGRRERRRRCRPDQERSRAKGGGTGLADPDRPRRGVVTTPRRSVDA